MAGKLSGIIGKQNKPFKLIIYQALYRLNSEFFFGFGEQLKVGDSEEIFYDDKEQSGLNKNLNKQNP